MFCDFLGDQLMQFGLIGRFQALGRILSPSFNDVIGKNCPNLLEVRPCELVTFFSNQNPSPAFKANQTKQQRLLPIPHRDHTVGHKNACPDNNKVRMTVQNYAGMTQFVFFKISKNYIRMISTVFQKWRQNDFRISWEQFRMVSKLNQNDVRKVQTHVAVMKMWEDCTWFSFVAGRGRSTLITSGWWM